MTTIQYIQRFGLIGAKTALTSIPDKTATHLGVVIDDEPTYYSLDFGSYWDNCDWQDSDYGTVSELSEAYKDGWCVDLSELKRLAESVDYLNEWYEGKIDDAYDHVERMYGMLKLRPQFPNLHARIQLVEGHLANYKAIYSDEGC